MNTRPLGALATIALVLPLVAWGASNGSPRATVPQGCEVQLFDGSRFKDDNVVVAGPGEFATLKKLPGTDKDWDDEADSFKSGPDAQVTFWSKPDFKGKKASYDGGAEEPSIDEPRSMKITCAN